MYLFILQILRRKKNDWTCVLIAKAQRRLIMRNDEQDAVIHRRHELITNHNEL